MASWRWGRQAMVGPRANACQRKGVDLGQALQVVHGRLQIGHGLFFKRQGAVRGLAVSLARQVETQDREPLFGQSAGQLDIDAMRAHAVNDPCVEQQDAGGPGRSARAGEGADQVGAPAKSEDVLVHSASPLTAEAMRRSSSGGASEALPASSTCQATWVLVGRCRQPSPRAFSCPDSSSAGGVCSVPM
jgi:hypothetical protein